jgi:hypothetical protein
MKSCEQTSGQTIWEHGESVRDHLLDLIGSQSRFDWRLPKWFTKDEFRSRLKYHLHDTEVLRNYTLYHDCGKPFCRTVDEQGRVHFSNHAQVSRDIYLQVFGDETVANLIGWDMVLHTASADQIDEYLADEWTLADASTLLLTALAEVHSNARLFGGIQSNSFKSKWKKIERRGRQICRYFKKGPIYL